jgi:hypothetical protein
MQTIFNQFKEQFYGKSLNEILGCAKFSCEGLQLVKDVDEYDNNEFAFVVGWYPNDEYNPNERIEVECLYSHLTGDAEFTLLHSKVRKFGRIWEIVQNLDLKITENGYPIWWEVLKMDDGVLWMNNCDGCMAFIENNGRVLKTYF